MPERDDYLAMDDPALQACCEVHLYRSSGPGGQHRNKVSSAVRLHHKATGVTATADDSRSQHDNRRMALRRLRMNLACQCRQVIEPGLTVRVPAIVRECTFVPRGPGHAPGLHKLQVGPKDVRFWRVAAFLLDLLEAKEGRLAEASAILGISTTNLANVLQSERHLLAEAQKTRKRHGHGPIG
jgi:hypothetical protein